MMRTLYRSKLLQMLLSLSFVIVAANAFAQFQPASPPIADTQDTRFDNVKEDVTSPSLENSRLLPVTALSAGVVDHPGYTVEVVRVQWRFADPIDLYIAKPKGRKNPPVVLYLYGHTSDTDRFREEKWQEGVTADGCAAVGFVSALTGQRYHDVPLKEWFVSDLQKSLARSAHDVQLILNYLSDRKDLDMDRVGMLAQDSGASIAILAAAVDPRIKALDLVDPWGDWPEWLATSPVVPDDERERYATPEFLTKVDGLEPVKWLPKVKAKVRLQDALFAISTPTEAKDKIRASVPPGATVVVYKAPEETREIQSGTNALQWVQSALSPGRESSSPSKTAQLTSAPASQQ